MRGPINYDNDDDNDDDDDDDDDDDNDDNDDYDVFLHIKGPLTRLAPWVGRGLIQSYSGPDVF